MRDAPRLDSPAWLAAVSRGEITEGRYVAERAARKQTGSTGPEGGLDAIAAVAAIALPGAGYLVRGRMARGLCGGGAVLGLVLCGLLIGGIDAVDSREDKAWYYGQMLVGPLVFAVDWYHQEQLKAYPTVRDGAAGIEVVRGAPDARSFRVSAGRLAVLSKRTVGPDERREVVDVTVEGTRPFETKLAVAVPAEDGVGAPPNRKSLAKMNEIGTLYVLVAGMMNLVLILDALFPSRGPSRGPAQASAKAGAS